MRDWQETKLGKIAVLSVEKILASDVLPQNYISTDNMLVNCGGIQDADTVPKSPKFNRYQETDTLFSNIRTYFKKVWLSDRKGGASPDVLIFRSINPNIVDPIYLYYTLSDQRFIDYTVLTSKGAKMPRGDKAAIMKYEINLPGIPEQRAISVVLRALDSKIELNRRMNATLEATARALFKSWFVDFDPVRAKMEGKQPFGMDTATAAIFPSRLVPSPLGDIPEGWHVKPVIESAEFINGAAYKNMHFSDAVDALPVIKIAELKNGIGPGTQYTNSDLGQKFRLDTGDVLFSWSGSPDTSIDTFIYTGGPAWLNQHIFKVVSTSNEKRCFTYWLLKYLNPTFIEIARDKQTTGLGHVTRADMQRIKFAEPSEDVAKAFYQKAGALMNRIQSNLSEGEHLSKIRDYLLPKLISGDIRIPDAKKFMEAA